MVYWLYSHCTRECEYHSEWIMCVNKAYSSLIATEIMHLHSYAYIRDLFYYSLYYVVWHLFCMDRKKVKQQNALHIESKDKSKTFLSSTDVSHPFNAFFRGVYIMLESYLLSRQLRWNVVFWKKRVNWMNAKAWTSEEFYFHRWLIS